MPEPNEPHETIRVRLTAAALGRLLSGDYGLEVDLSRQTVEQCARKYLHTILRDDGFKLWAKKEAEELKAAVERLVGGTEYVHGQGSRVKLREWVVDLVKREVKEVVQHACGEAFSVVLAEQSAKLTHDLTRFESKMMGDVREKLMAIYKDLDAKVNARVDANVADRIRESALSTLNRAVEIAKEEPKV